MQEGYSKLSRKRLGNEELGLEISITDKAAYLATQSNKVLVSEELTKKFNIPQHIKTL